MYKNLVAVIVQILASTGRFLVSFRIIYYRNFMVSHFRV